MQVKALITIHHNGKEIKPNGTVDIKDEEAKSFIKRGFAIAVTKEAKVEETPSITIDDIVEVIAELDPKKDFGKNSKPNVDAIETLLDVNITAEQRDKAWELFKKESG